MFILLSLSIASSLDEKSSVNHECHNNSLVSDLLLGLILNIFDNQSNPLSFNIFLHSLNLFFKQFSYLLNMTLFIFLLHNLLQLGHSLSSIVPRTENILFNCFSSFSP